MNKFTFIMVFAVFAVIVCTTCKIENNAEKEAFLESPYIEGLTIDNFPGMDGSTSTYPLIAIIACKLFDIDYEWVQRNDGTWNVYPQMSDTLKKKFDKLIKSSQTHNSFINLITKDADLILTARKMSDNEIIYANEAGGISLTETPVALDAFIFIVNPNNSIESLTIKQIQDIYMGEITYWNKAGGDSAPINPYVRNRNSGSQELMDSLVMKDLDYYWNLEISDEVVVFTMTGAFERVSTDKNAICYTLYYYKENIVKKDNFTKTIAVNGILPNKETNGGNLYPLAAAVYAVIRSDTDKSSMAYKVYEWLRTEAGKQAISESGYIPY